MFLISPGLVAVCTRQNCADLPPPQESCSPLSSWASEGALYESAIHIASKLRKFTPRLIDWSNKHGLGAARARPQIPLHPGWFILQFNLVELTHCSCWSTLVALVFSNILLLYQTSALVGFFHLNPGPKLTQIQSRAIIGQHKSVSDLLPTITLNHHSYYNCHFVHL